MITKRIIPCLDVKNGMVVKGVEFKDHKIMGDIVELAKRYVSEGADELVFYDITASCEGRTLDRSWISRIASFMDIPFCVAGGIKTIADAEEILSAGAEKISVNTPALESPNFITELAKRFGSQCVTVGIDSREENGEYFAYKYTGDEKKTIAAKKNTLLWAKEVIDRGAGEIVLNCMNQDGVRAGYDIKQLALVRDAVSVPLIASGGAGEMQHFLDVFENAKVDGALAASVFHKNIIPITELKQYLKNKGVNIR